MPVIFCGSGRAAPGAAKVRGVGVSEFDDDFMRDLNLRVQEAKRADQLHEGKQALSRVGDDLDDRVNFRVNGVLKYEFERVCKRDHTTISREIKRFMTKVIEDQKVF